MERSEKPTILLDISKGLGYSLLYNPVIGKIRSVQYPQISRFRVGAPPVRRKFLCS